MNILSKKILNLSYLLLNIILLVFIYRGEHIEQVVIKFISSIILLLIYTRFTKKLKWNLYFFISLYAFLFGDILYSFPFHFFNFALIFYGIVYVSIFIYLLKKQTIKKDLFKIFTFSLPFLFSYSLVMVMLKNLSEIMTFILFCAAILSSTTTSLALLNYANDRTSKNYLMFIGCFLLQLVNFFSVTYHFNEYDNDIFYLITQAISVTAQYFICLSFTKHTLQEQ